MNEQKKRKRENENPNTPNGDFPSSQTISISRIRNKIVNSIIKLDNVFPIFGIKRSFGCYFSTPPIPRQPIPLAAFFLKENKL